MKDKMTGVHLSHCYQGEYKNSCKFGDDFCPARLMTEQIDRPPTKPVPSHSETMSCPHCGEEFGIEDKVEYERTTTRDADAEYYEARIEALIEEIEAGIYALELDMRIEDMTALYGFIGSFKKEKKR